MRQGNGSDLLGLKDSRSTKIGIIYVAPNDDRKSVLTAILTQEKLGRKQIAVVLPEDQPNKAFHHSQDFDDLKAVRRKLRAQLVFIAAGLGPAEFARQRRFSVYSSLGSYADALGAEPSPLQARNGLAKLIAPLARTDQPSSTSARDAQASPKIAGSTPADLINQDAQQPMTPEIPSTDSQDDWDALSPTSSTSSSQMDALTVETTPPLTLSSTPDPAAGAKPSSIELHPSPPVTQSRATAKLPAIEPLAANTKIAQSSATVLPHTPSQESSAGRTVAIIDAKAPPPVLYKTTTGRSPALSSKSAPTGATHKKSDSRGLIAVILIAAVLLICAGIASCASGQQLFGFGLFANGNTAPATITITPKSKIEQDSYVIQAVTSNADSTKRQIVLRQLTFSPPKQSKSVTATGVGQIGAARAAGTLVFSNGSGKDFPLQAGTAIQNANGIEVTTDQYIDIPAGNPLDNFVATVSVPAHAANPGTSGNIGALTIDQFCCTSGNAVGVKNPNAFSGGKNAKEFSYLQQSDVDSVVSQLKPTLSQQAQAGLKSQIRPNEQLIDNPQCTTQPTVDQPIGDQGQGVTAATITIDATCTGLVYDTGAAQKLAQNLLTKKATSDLGPGYVLKGTIMTRQAVTDVQDSVVTLQVAAAGTWYYQFDDNQKQTLAKQLANKSYATAQRILNDSKGIAKAKIDIANGSNLLPDNSQEISIIVARVSEASPSDLPALPTVMLTRSSSTTGGRG